MALTPIHPGEHLAEELEALGMSASELARRIKEILNGSARLPETPLCAWPISLAPARSFG